MLAKMVLGGCSRPGFRAFLGQGFQGFGWPQALVWVKRGVSGSVQVWFGWNDLEGPEFVLTLKKPQITNLKPETLRQKSYTLLPKNLLRAYALQPRRRQI